MSGTRPMEEKFDCRVAFAEELIALARQDPRIVAVCNDSVGSSNLNGFQREFPDRLINVGIAEQNMVGVAAGLANGGFIPVVSCAAPFLTGRALEQIKVDVAYSNYHVVLCGQSPGMSYGELGPTHHSIEDFAWLRALDNMTVLAPADPIETRAALRWAVATDRPVYLRIGRVNPQHFNFDINVAEKKYDLAEFVSDNAVDAADVPALIGKVEPDSDQYRATEAALAHYLSLAHLQAAAAEIELMAQALDPDKQLPLALCGGLATALQSYFSDALQQRLVPAQADSADGALQLLQARPHALSME